MRFSRVAITLVVLATLILCLGLAAAAFAADSVRVIPSAVASPDPGQLDPVISGDFLAYTSTNPEAALSDESHIALKYLGDDSAPYIIPTPDYPPVGTPDFKDMDPAILYDAGSSSIYVIWTRYDLNSFVGHLMIWKGTYGMPVAGGATTFIPDDGYPRTFVQGPEAPVAEQAAAAIGLVAIGAEQHVVAAWQDTRETCPGVPEVFWLDLTAEPVWSPVSSGEAVDSTGVLGRGQYLPAVGATGVYWLDDRFSWWDDGNLTDTAVYRFDVGARESAYFFRDTDHSYDNGSGYDFGPQAIAGGALWLRTGPYGAGVWTPFVKTLGGSTRTLSPITQPASPSTYTKVGASSTGLAIMGKHGNNASAVDYDIFYFDTTAGTQVPVCARSVASSDANPDYFKGNQMMPAIGDGFFSYRVVWADQRDSLGEDAPDAKLYEAFVPTVTWTIRASSIPNLSALRSTVTVKPDFRGEPVKLQRVTPVKQLGRTYYKPYGRGYLATATMTAGAPNSNSSVGALKWTPTAKGTYYLRVWFAGAAKYTYDGQTIAQGNAVAVPTVGNYSKVVKLIVK
jgi:hypothetical protein